MLLCIYEQILVWHFVHDIRERRFRNQIECFKYRFLDFIENFAPIFVQKQVRAIAERFVALVQIFEIKMNSANERIIC